MFGTNWMKMAPKSAPGIDARPPTTTPTSRKIDSDTVKLSGETKAITDRAQRAGHAGERRRDAEGQRLEHRAG